MAAKKKATCLVKGCNLPARSRGLCGNCLEAARRAVKQGKTTWEELESQKLALPCRRSKFHRALAGAKAKQSAR